MIVGEGWGKAHGSWTMQGHDEERRLVLAILAIYRVLLVGVLVLGCPWWLWRMATAGRYRAGLWERLGWVPHTLREAVAEAGGAPWVWVHAVSVGEVLAAAGVVQGLQKQGLRVAVSTTTEAGQNLAKERLAGCPTFYLPLDFGFLMTRYLVRIRPSLVVTMESELWPNLIHACYERKVPLAVVNARVSDRSFPRYMRLRAVWRPLLREISSFLAQSEEAADRLQQMGVSGERIKISGNLKYDTGLDEATARTRAVASWLRGRKLVVAGSTLPGEEDTLLSAWRAVTRVFPEAVLIIAPRHENRFQEVFRIMCEAGLAPLRASGLPEQADPGNALLLDTIGDLGSLYRIATVAFVGGSLVPRGGHNPLEAARFGVPVVMGASWFNFREIVQTMLSADAIQIVGEDEVAQVLTGVLRDGDRGMGERGRQVFQSQAGATQRTLTALLELTR